MNNVDNKCINASSEMITSLFQECRPIITAEDIQTVVDEPPQWIERIEPIHARSSTVVKNVIGDCHSNSTHIPVRLRYDKRTVPKTLVCHDYKGGYQDDRFLHMPNEDIVGNGYTFYNWSQIDIFVYFSHHFVTIPPLCWINVAHTNGVKILGTFITEFDQGSKICSKIFKDMETMQNFARNLAKITKIFNIDGWLLNIENKVDVAILPVVKSFVSYFADCIHQDDPENVVIWYDSVTEEGKLQWQNELNSQNQYFFDSCDGIFLNYVWTEDKLLSSVKIAENRNLDVYVGIDVFGRNTYGGGMFNCNKAANLARSNNLSIAIFAPGWTYESLSKTDNVFEDFLNKDSAFWTSLWPYLYTHPVTKYFETTFYIGLDKSYYNLFNQQQQLSRSTYPHATANFASEISLNRCVCIQCTVVANKNACLLTNKNLRISTNSIHHLFTCDLKVASGIVIYFLTKNLKNKTAKLTVTMSTCNDYGKFRTVKLLSKAKVDRVDNKTILEINPSDDVDVIESIGSKYNSDDYKKMAISVYTLNVAPCKILEIGATIDEGHSIYLCAFGIREKHTVNDYVIGP